MEIAFLRFFIYAILDKSTDAHNGGLRSMKDNNYQNVDVLFNSGEYEKRIVAFVDVMGMKARMANAREPKDFTMYVSAMSLFANLGYLKGKLHVTMFSDCMYIVADKLYIDYVISMLANFAYKLLFNISFSIDKDKQGNYTSFHETLDPYKLRGGITYGEVFVLDEEAEKRNITSHSNILFGPAVIRAYSLESTIAVYPRIIVDDAFLQLMDEMKKKKETHYIVEESGEYYIDFLDYMCHGIRESLVLERLPSYIEFIDGEIQEALKMKNSKLIGQLLWYKQYLEKHLPDKK